MCLKKSIDVLRNKGFNTFRNGWHPSTVSMQRQNKKREEWKYSLHRTLLFIIHSCSIIVWMCEKKNWLKTWDREKKTCYRLLMYKTYRHMRRIKIYPKLLIVNRIKKEAIPLRPECYGWRALCKRHWYNFPSYLLRTNEAHWPTHSKCILRENCIYRQHAT